MTQNHDLLQDLLSAQAGRVPVALTTVIRAQGSVPRHAGAKMLVYGDGLMAEHQGKSRRFCSDWCIEWSALRESGQDYFQLKIVPPTVNTSR